MRNRRGGFNFLKYNYLVGLRVIWMLSKDLEGINDIVIRDLEFEREELERVYILVILNSLL